MSREITQSTIERALAGDKEAARQCTEAGVLLPCPFCGGEAELIHDDETTYGHPTPNWAVQCVMGACIGADIEPRYTVMGKAIECWNRRVQTKDWWISVNERLPDSGTHVLLCCEVRPSGWRYVCDGYYAKAKSITCSDYDEYATEYDDNTDEYYLLEGYYEVIKNWDDFSSVVIGDFVTHWMALPETPKEVDAG